MQPSQTERPSAKILLLASALACAAPLPACEGPVEAEDAPGARPSAFVVTSDFESGSFAVIDAQARTVYPDLGLIHQDAVCRSDARTGLVYVVARRGADAVSVVDPEAGWRVVGEYSVGAGTNAQDIAVVADDLAYVARLQAPDILGVDPADGTIRRTIGLGALADADGIPEVTWLGYREGKLYALLARLEEFHPADYSLLVVIDAASGAVEKALRLAVPNPSGRLRYSEAVERFVIIESGAFTSLNEEQELDGAIEYFDPKTNTLSGPKITAAALGGDILDAVIAASDKGFAAIEEGCGADVRTRLVSFDPTSGEKTGDLAATAEWALSALELSPNGEELWVADRSPTRPGIRIFDVESGKELTAEPLDVGLPPFMICFVASGSDAADAGLPDAGPDDAGPSADAGPRGEPADTVEEALGATGSGFGDPTRAVNGVRGAGETGSSQDVYSLGFTPDVDNSITVSWSGRRVTNGPGPDFVVFENGFRVSDESYFMDQVVVFLSRDGTTFVPFPFDYVAANEEEYSSRPADWTGFGGVWPVLYNEDSNRANPFDFARAGGDAFDLGDLPDQGEAGAIRQEGFVELRLVAAPSLVNPDTGRPFVRDAVSNGADVDGVYGRYFAPR